MYKTVLSAALLYRGVGIKNSLLEALNETLFSMPRSPRTRSRRDEGKDVISENEEHVLRYNV